MKLIVSQEAAADLERLYAFLANRDRAAAKRVAGSLVAAMQSLDVLPDRGRPVGTAGLRELVVRFGRSGYIVRYAHRAAQDEVTILRIWHGREARE